MDGMKWCPLIGERTDGSECRVCLQKLCSTHPYDTEELV